MIDDRMVELLKAKMDEEWGPVGSEFVPEPPITHEGDNVYRCLLRKRIREDEGLTGPIAKLTLIQGGKRD